MKPFAGILVDEPKGSAGKNSSDSESERCFSLNSYGGAGIRAGIIAYDEWTSEF